MRKQKSKKQYGSCLFYRKGEYRVAKQALQDMINSHVPKKYHKQIIWLKQHDPRLKIYVLSWKVVY